MSCSRGYSIQVSRPETPRVKGGGSVNPMPGPSSVERGFIEIDKKLKGDARKKFMSECLKS